VRLDRDLPMPRVEIEIEQQLIDELSEAFFWEEQRSALYLDELSEARSERESPSPFVVARVNGLKVMIRPGEHGDTKVKKLVIQFCIAAVCEAKGG
jgi:hypothetical protein